MLQMREICHIFTFLCVSLWAAPPPTAPPPAPP